MSLREQLELKLKDVLPGESAQYIMAPVNRQRVKIAELKENEYRKSAVMLLICKDDDGDYFIPLTERFSYDGVHSGQVSLPGGKWEDADGSFENTALRETFEEIGVAPDGVQVLGALSSLFIPVSQFLVYPVVGYCGRREAELLKNPLEVKHIVKLKLNDLLDENLIRNGTVTAGGVQIKTPYFFVEGLKVWGATAMILSEFKTVLKTIF